MLNFLFIDDDDDIEEIVEDKEKKEEEEEEEGKEAKKRKRMTRRKKKEDDEEWEEEEEEEKDEEEEEDEEEKEGEEGKEEGKEETEEDKEAKKKKIEELETSVKEKEEQVDAIRVTLKDNQKQMEELKKEIYKREKVIAENQKKIAAICAKARNAYSKKQIVKDFNAGLAEMKRKAEGKKTSGGDEEEEEEEEGEGIDLDEDSQTKPQGQASDQIDLPVFTVSSYEYLKLCGRLTRDGPTQTFSELEDTEIPNLQKFVHSLTKSIRIQTTKHLIHSLVSFVRNIYIYVRCVSFFSFQIIITFFIYFFNLLICSDGGTMDSDTRKTIKRNFDKCLAQLEKDLLVKIGEFKELADGVFKTKIEPRFAPILYLFP